MKKLRLKDIGEKEIIRSIIRPLFNPTKNVNSVGDDCAVLKSIVGRKFCASTDRVPADLIAYKIGLIGYFELGYYLAILNLSDLAASGATPEGLLLNLAFPSSFFLDDFRSVLKGVKKACSKYGCSVLGGDLSTSGEVSISATSIGFTIAGKVLFRKGCRAGDYIYCSDYLGLATTGFYYFLYAKPKGLRLSGADETLLLKQFSSPMPSFGISKILYSLENRVTCMDNTDGIAQSFLELAEINNLRFVLHEESLPVHPVSVRVSQFLNLDLLDVILGTGADFQLVGTIDKAVDICQFVGRSKRRVRIIGATETGMGVSIKRSSGHKTDCKIKGWNYFSGKGFSRNI